MLLMKKRFFEAIRAGRKTTTLRYWQRPIVRAGGVRTVPGLGKVRIDSVEAIAPDRLTDADARADGFDGVEAMLAALREIYPPQTRAKRTLYKVGFTYLGDGEKATRP